MTETIAMIQENGKEILAYADNSRVKDAAIYSEMGESDIEDALHKLYRHANAIPTGLFKDDGAQSTLVRKMLEFTMKPETISSVSADIAGTCFQAELRFARSLGRNLKDTSTTSSRLPAAIVYDEDTTPFAYQKADGHPTAYAWRSGTLNTLQGPRWIPEGSIIELAYGKNHKDGVYQDDPRRKYQGFGLIALKNLIPDDVYLKRVSTEYLPEELREAAAEFAIADVPSLASYRKQAIGFSARKVEERMPSLIDRAEYAIPQAS